MLCWESQQGQTAPLFEGKKVSAANESRENLHFQRAHIFEAPSFCCNDGGGALAPSSVQKLSYWNDEKINGM